MLYTCIPVFLYAIYFCLYFSECIAQVYVAMSENSVLLLTLILEIMLIYGLIKIQEVFMHVFSFYEINLIRRKRMKIFFVFLKICF